MLPGPQPILTFTTVAPQGLHWDPWSCPPAKVILLSQWADQEKIKQLVSSKFVLEHSSFAVKNNFEYSSHCGTVTVVRFHNPLAFGSDFPKSDGDPV